MSYFEGNAWLARASFRATNGSAQQVMTLHYLKGDSLLGSGAQIQDIADRLRDDVLAPFKAMFTGDWTIDPITVTDEKDPLFPLEPRNQVTSGAAGPGTRAGLSNKLPLAMSALAQLRTDKIGRSFRGRIWLPGVKNEADLNGDHWEAVSGYREGYTALMAAIPIEPDIEAIHTGPVNLVVYSRTRRALGASTYAGHVQSISSDHSVHWLRRRDDGVG